MKRALLCLLALSGVAMAEGEKVFDKEGFEKDTAYFTEHKADAQAIVTLLAKFNADNDGIKQAFDGYAAGDTHKWSEAVNKLKAARKYQDKLEAFSYFAGCRNAVIYADLMWQSGAAMMRTPDEWRNSESFNLKQFKEAKKTFRAEFADCKSALNSAPKEQDYYRENVETIGSWELNSENKQ